MIKALFTLLAWLLTLVAAQAQPTPPPASEPAGTFRYCVLVVTGQYFARPGSLYLDYGQDQPGAAADPEMLAIATLKQMTVVGLLNVLGQHHWELTSTVTVPTEVRKSSLNDRETFLELETRYVLRRRMP